MSENEAVVLMLMSLGAFFMPFISKRLLMPSAVGEIIYGVIIASALSGGGEAMNVVSYFSAFGFLILMYMAGLEIDFDRFRALSKKDLLLYILTAVPAVGAAFAFTKYLGLASPFVLIFFTSGIGLLFPVLKDLNLLKTNIGQNILMIGMLAEVLTLVGLTAATMTYKYGISVKSALHILYIAGFFTVVYLVMRILKIVLWWNPNLQSYFLEVGNSTETGIRTNFLILFTFVAFAAVMEIELVVGAFIGGAMFALVFSGREGVLEKLGGVGYGFFIPLFFIFVGTRVTFKDFLNKEVIILSLIITGVILAVKVCASIPLLFSSLKKIRIPLVTLGLSFPLTMLVAVSSVCFDAGMISRQESSAILLASMITAIIYPWLFKVTSFILIPDMSDEEKV